MGIREFVHGRSWNFSGGLGRHPDPQFSQLPNLEVDRFRFDGRSGCDALAIGCLEPPHAPAQEQRSFALATALFDSVFLRHVPILLRKAQISHSALANSVADVPCILLILWWPRWGSNPHETCASPDFES